MSRPDRVGIWGGLLALLVAAGCAAAPGASGDVRPARTEGPLTLALPDRLDRMGLQLRWQAKVQAPAPRRVHLGARTCYVEAGNVIHALDRRSGFYKWMLELPGPLDAPPGESVVPQTREDQASGRDTAYFAAKQQLTAVDIHDPRWTGRELGTMLWTQCLPFRASGTPMASDFFLACGAEDHGVYVYKLRESDPQSPGGVRRMHVKAWHYDTGGEMGGALVLPTDSPDQIIAASCGGVVMSRSLSDGSVRWRYPFERDRTVGGVRWGLAYDTVRHPPGKDNLAGRLERTLYVGSLDHGLDVIDPDGGLLLERVLLSEGIEVKPLVVSRVVKGEGPDWAIVRDLYCVAMDGKLFAFRVEDLHRARRGDDGQPALDEHGEPKWLSEDADGDDVFGGEETEVITPANPDEESEEEASRRRVFRKMPLRWRLRQSWTRDGVARILCRGRNGLYVEGRDGQLWLLGKDGAPRWQEPMGGVLDLPADFTNPFEAAPAFHVLDGTGTLWCLEEK